MWRTYEVRETERLVLFREGRVDRVLGAGRHTVWGRHDAQRVDLRTSYRAYDVERLWTADAVCFGARVVVGWRVTDAVAALTRVVSAAEAMAVEAQSAMARSVAAVRAMELAAARSRVEADALDRLALEVTRFGLAVESLWMSEVRWPRRLRRKLKSEGRLNGIANGSGAGQ